jgi:ribonucleoside-diphosphate reductase alpha chain
MSTEITRHRLPTERRSITHRFKVGDTYGYIIVGLYEDGQPGELFIRCGTVGSTISGLLDAISLQTSLLLQLGYPLKDLVNKFSRTSYEPAGHTKELGYASSILDYVFRWLDRRFTEVAS